MTRKKTVLFGLLGSILFLISLFIAGSGLCSLNYICNRPHDDALAFILFPIIPFFIFSLITFKMREEVYLAWWKFARVWVPLSMLAILVSPSYTSNWMFPIEKGTVSFFTSALFLIISAALIGYKYTQPRKN